jgi:glucose/arabinose dehydrogenase
VLPTAGKLASLFALLAGLVVVPGVAAEARDGGARHGSPSVGLRLVAEGLTAPVTLVPANDRSRRLFVVDQTGLIRIIDPRGTLAPEPFLDLRDRLVTLRPNFDERGLLGLAFHPGYARNGRFFVYYNAPLRPEGPAGFDTTVRISEFRVSATDPDSADPASERVLLEVDKPQFNHNAGTLLFGPRDRYLYIAIGDGGGSNDAGLGHVEDWYADNAGGNAQNVTDNLLGKILRIDVDQGRPYGIPRDNPFVGKPGLDEIYAYGLRNPYRMSFDTRGRHSLIVGDVGQNLWEEVNVVTRGGNYGWNIREGAHCFDAENPRVPPAECPTAQPGAGRLIEPVLEYANASQPSGLGLSVIGGHIYRGRDLAGLHGRYIFGDWSTGSPQPDGSLLVATPRPKGQWSFQDLRVNTTAGGRVGHHVLGLGLDHRAELYLLTSDLGGPTGNTGKVYRLVR